MSIDKRDKRENSGYHAMRAKGKPAIVGRMRLTSEETDDNGTVRSVKISDAGFVATVRPDAKSRQNFWRFVRANGIIATPLGIDTDTQAGTDADSFQVTGDTVALGKLWDMPFLRTGSTRSGELRSFAMSIRVPYIAGGSGTLSATAEKRVKEAMRPMDAGFQRKADFQACRDERNRLNKLKTNRADSPYFDEQNAVDTFRAETESMLADGDDVRLNDEMLLAVAKNKARELLVALVTSEALPEMGEAQRTAMREVLTQWYLANDTAPADMATLARFAASL